MYASTSTSFLRVYLVELKHTLYCMPVLQHMRYRTRTAFQFTERHVTVQPARHAYHLHFADAFRLDLEDAPAVRVEDGTCCERMSLRFDLKTCRPAGGVGDRASPAKCHNVLGKTFCVAAVEYGERGFGIWWQRSFQARTRGRLASAFFSGLFAQPRKLLKAIVISIRGSDNETGPRLTIGARRLLKVKVASRVLGVPKDTESRFLKRTTRLCHCVKCRVRVALFLDLVADVQAYLRHQCTKFGLGVRDVCMRTTATQRYKVYCSRSVKRMIIRSKSNQPALMFAFEPC
jgi:hypothetical protein